MKLLRTLGYLLIILVVLYIVLCFAGPKKFEVIKSVNVGASATTVFGEVSDFNKWKDWSPWMKADPNMKPTFAGTPSQIGHMMTWTSESQGSGSQEIVEVLPGQFMKTRLKFTDWDGETNCAMTMEEKGDSTKVSWTMDGSPIAFPLRGLMVVLGAQKSIEEDYTKGLSDLKTIVEAMPKSPAASPL